MNTSYRLSFFHAINDNLYQDGLDRINEANHPLGPCLGVEIGVHHGKLSAFLLRKFPGLHLTLVDPWKEWGDDDRYRLAGHRIANEDQDANYRLAMETVAPYVDRTDVMRMLSIEAADYVANGSLDFVIIDGDHSEEGCWEDMEAWYPKVRFGGVLMGHDYGRRKWGVKKAVNRFVEERCLDLQVHPKSVWACPIPTPIPA